MMFLEELFSYLFGVCLFENSLVNMKWERVGSGVRLNTREQMLDRIVAFLFPLLHLLTE